MANQFSPELRKMILPPEALLALAIEQSYQAQGDEARQLALRAGAEQGAMHRICGGRQVLPSKLDDLSYKSLDPIQRLRNIPPNWDGRGAKPPSELVVAYAEFFWNAVSARFSGNSPPQVEPGPENLVEFAWSLPSVGKLLKIGLYDDDGEIVCDWHIDLAGKVKHGELPAFSLNVLLDCVKCYHSF